MHAPVLAFDLDSDGHHPSYLQYLATRWLERDPGRELILVVARDFPERHPDVVGLATPGKVRFDAIPRPEVPRFLRGPAYAVGRGVQEWRTLGAAVRRHGAGHAVVMYIDQMLQGPLAMQLPGPCPVSGIYFRPAFYYGQLGQPETGAEKRRGLQQRLTLRAALRHRRLHTLWSLDPYAVDPILELGRRSKVEALADPVPAAKVPKKTLKELELRYGLRASKATRLLLFGALGERKGIVQSLQAAETVAQAGDALTVLLVGRFPEHFRQRLEDAVRRAEAAGVTIVRNHAFVDEDEVQAHFELADIVLAPYQRHVGSSGIAIRAARAGKPLLASSYGMLGESVRREGLGVAVDATSSAALAAGLRDLLDHEVPVSALGMKRFAEANTATAFADAIIATTCQAP